MAHRSVFRRTGWIARRGGLVGRAMPQAESAFAILTRSSGVSPVRLRERIRAFGPTVPFGEAARERLVA